MACLRYGRGRPLFLPSYIPKRKQGDKLHDDGLHHERVGGAVTADRPRKKHAREQKREHSRYDQDLGAAKNSGRTVRFTMAQEASFTDEECEVDAQVLQIDKFDIEVVPQGWSIGNSIWLKKSAIMATRIFR